MADEIFRLDIDIQAMLKKQEQLKKQTDDLKQSIKELDTSTKEGREAFVRQEAALKGLQKEYNSNRTALSKLSDETGNFATANEQATKAVNRQVDSIEDARASNKELLNIRNKVNLNTEEGRKAVERINKKLNENNEFIKENVSNYEQQKIGIGDYEGAIKRALPGLSGLIDSTKEFVQGLIAQKAALQASTAGTTGATKALKLFKIALASTGIGAIVIALGSLIAYLTQTQKGMDLVNQVMEGAKAIFQVLIDRLLSFGSGLHEIFVKGNFSEGVDKLKSSFAGLGDEIVEEAKAAARFEKQLQDIEKAESRLEVRRAQQRADFEELKKKSDDVNFSIQQRAEFAEKGLSGEKKLLDEQLDLLEQRLKITKEQNALGTSTEEDLQKERDLEIQIANLRQESAAKQTELNNKLNSLKEQANKQEQAAIQAQIKLQEERVQKSIEGLQEELEYYRTKNRSILDMEEELTDELVRKEEERQQQIFDRKKEILEAEYEAGKMSELAYRTELLNLEYEYQDDIQKVRDEYKQQQEEQREEEKEKEEERKQEELEKEEEEYQQRLEIMRLRGDTEYEIQLQELEREKATEIARAKEIGVETSAIEERYQKKKSQIAAAESNARLQNAANVVSGIQSLVSEQSQLGKAAALAQAGINIAQGVTKAIAQGGIAGIATGATVASAGAIQIAKIAGVKTFEDGGILEGPPHKDGGIPFTISGKPGFEAEGGEYVVNKKATKMFLPLLESINSKYNFSKSSGVGLFQNGGILTSRLPGANGQGSVDVKALARANSQAFAEAIRNIPNPVVYVDDINTGQQRVAEVVEGATI